MKGSRSLFQVQKQPNAIVSKIREFNRNQNFKLNFEFRMHLVIRNCRRLISKSIKVAFIDSIISRPTIEFRFIDF